MERKARKIYKAMSEFEQEYLPKSFERKMAQKPKDAQALGVSLAKESLEKVRGQLAKL